jgi:hypothetical protein
MILFTDRPPSSSGLGYLVLSQGTGVRVPVGVLEANFIHRHELSVTADVRQSGLSEMPKG